MLTLRYLEWGIFLLWFTLGWVLWRQRRDRRPGKWALCAAWAALFLYSWKPCATLLIGLLEWQAPIRPATNPGAQVMVVLSGALNVVNPPEPSVFAAFSTDVRCRHAAWLYHHGWRMPVVPSGGAAGPGFTYAAVMDKALQQEGLPAEDIWIEDRSQSTYESARYTADLLHSKGIRRILLVTEAYHMPRAVRLFRRAGLEVIASPCAYRTRDFHGSWQDWLILAPKSMSMNEEALHEGLALLYSWAWGRL
jgi:uncharacterized SAM-binding protein YcdF (DUF218 family)